MTPNQRRSVSGITPIPDGIWTPGDRKQAAGLYRGNAITTAATPPDRLFLIAAETRIFDVEAEVRFFSVPAEKRIFEVSR